MANFLTRYEGYLYAILRVIGGALFACHGAQKLFGVLGGESEINDPEGLAAGIIEFGCGILVCLGLFTRVAAFLASGKWRWLISRRMLSEASGRSRTTASWLCFMRSSFFTSLSEDMGLRASTRFGRNGPTRPNDYLVAHAP